MTKTDILSYFQRLDNALTAPTVLHIYGSAAVMLLGADDRTSLDIDVAGLYSIADTARFAEASASAGLPVNPASDSTTEYVEWVGPLRLCLPPPSPESEPVILWRGANLTVQTSKVEDLVASKLIRYDETDQSDIQFLFKASRFTIESIAVVVKTLPRPFNTDALVLENLRNLETDLRLWEAKS
jgi:hypothetical protein